MITLNRRFLGVCSLPLSAFLPAEITDVEIRNVPGEEEKSLEQRNPSGIELLAEDRASSVISAWQMLGSYRHRMQRTPSERSQPVFALDAARADVLLYSDRKKEPFHTRLSSLCHPLL